MPASVQWCKCNCTCLLLLQAFNSSSALVMRGSASILSGLQVYQMKEWVLRSWRDVFVDLVQGQLQFLFLSLLAGTAPPRPPWGLLLVMHQARLLQCCCYSDQPVILTTWVTTWLVIARPVVDC